MKFTLTVVDFRTNPYLCMELVKAKIEHLLGERNTGFIEFDIAKSGPSVTQENTNAR